MKSSKPQYSRIATIMIKKHGSYEAWIQFMRENGCKGGKNNKGKKLTPEHRFNISKGQGPRNILYKTKQYNVAHDWIVKQRGKPKTCEICNDINKSRYEWSNKSQEYNLDLNDWQRLCCSCHTKYDINAKIGKIYA